MGEGMTEEIITWNGIRLIARPAVEFMDDGEEPCCTECAFHRRISCPGMDKGDRGEVYPCEVKKTILKRFRE